MADSDGCMPQSHHGLENTPREHNGISPSVTAQGSNGDAMPSNEDWSSQALTGLFTTLRTEEALQTMRRMPCPMLRTPMPGHVAHAILYHFVAISNMDQRTRSQSASRQRQRLYTFSEQESRTSHAHDDKAPSGGLPVASSHSPAVDLPLPLPLAWPALSHLPAVPFAADL